MTDHPYTPHGPAADAAVQALITQGFAALRARRLVPPEAIGTYLVGDYARGEGWIAQEAESWIPYDTPHLVILLPEEFGPEASAAEETIQAQLAEICQVVGYSLRVSAASVDQLADHALLAFAMATSRRLVWSYDGNDPLVSLISPKAEQLRAEAQEAFLALEPKWQDLAGLSGTELFSIHQGVMRLAFIRVIEVISGLGDAILLNAGRYQAPLERRLEALLELAEASTLRPELAALYAAAIALRIRQPRPTIPAWEAMRTLISEVLAWSRYVAHSQFGAEVVQPAA